MAHWGIALSRWGNPFAGLRSPQQIELGRAAIQKAQATGSPTPRERAFIAAAAELYTSADASTQRARTVAYEQAMERVVRANPGDMEARIFYALAVNQTALATDKTIFAAVESRGHSRAALQGASEAPGPRALHHPRLRPSAAGGQGARQRRAAMRPSRRRCRTRCTCRRTRSRASACGRNRSRPTGDRQKRRSRRMRPPKRCTRWTTRPTRTCRLRRMPKRGAWPTRRAPRLARLDPNATGAAAPGVAGVFAAAAIPARYALERGAWAEAAALTVQKTSVSAHRRDHALRARARRCPFGKSQGRSRRYRSACRASRRAEGHAGCVLGRAGRHPAPDRDRVGHLRGRRQERAASSCCAPRPRPKTPPTNRRSRRARSRRRASCSATCCSRPIGRPTRSSSSRRRSRRSRTASAASTEERGRRRQPGSARVRSRSTNSCCRSPVNQTHNRPELQHARALVK